MTNRAAALRPILMGSAGFAAAMALISPAQAQTAPATTQTAVTTDASTAPEVAEQGKDIVITGTRIARPDLQVASPVSVVGQQEIAFKQVNTAEQLLRDLPSVRPNLGPAVNNGGDGSASIELRGIGTNRTLVLMDGRRIVPFGLDNVVDLNAVPTAVVERVDVVTGGASSTYGADAVAGVVNFVTMKNYQGVKASGNYGISELGDARDYRADVTTGANIDGGRGNVLLSVGYSKRSPLLVTDRAIGRLPVSSANGQFYGISGSGPVSVISSPINTSPYGRVVNTTTGFSQPATQADIYNTNIGTYFQTPLKRFNAFASAHYEISKAFELYTTAMFTRATARLQLAPSGTFSNTYQIPLSNPYLPAGLRSELCTARGISAPDCAAAATATSSANPAYREVPVTANRRFVEYGARGQEITTNMFQIQTGLRGDITSTLHYDLSGQYGETRQNQVRQNWGSSSRVQQALRAYNNAGTLTCQDTSAGCVPLNLFGPAGSITQDQVNFIALDSYTTRIVRQEVITGQINGDLFGLTSPLAEKPVAFSLGGEYRHISARALPDAAAQVQGEVLGTGARTPPDFGQYGVKEVFGELIAPIVSEKPFVYSLQLEGGVRLSDYTTTGKSTTWKAGGSYEPIHGFKIRGMYQVAVRSPNIQELYQSQVVGLGSLQVDPCQASALPSVAANPQLAALCIATGAPASTIGNINPPSSSQPNTTTSGNRNLGVERAKTFTVGGVFTPARIPRFSATVDYWHIDVSQAISSPAVADISNGCYTTALNPTLSYSGVCLLIKRNPTTGQLSGGPDTPGFLLTNSNLGHIQTAGVDFGVNYRFDFADFGITKDIGRLSVSFNGTWLNYYYFQANPQSINRDCTARYSASGCTNPRPGWKYNTRLTYSYGPFDVSMLWRHIGAVGLEPFQATVTQPLTTPQPGGVNPNATTFLNGIATNGVLPEFRRIQAYNYFDLSLHAETSSNVDFTLTVDNLFNKRPPLVGNSVGGTAFNNGNTFPTIYDVVGRRYTVGATFKF